MEVVIVMRHDWAEANCWSSSFGIGIGIVAAAVGVVQ